MATAMTFNPSPRLYNPSPMCHQDFSMQIWHFSTSNQRELPFGNKETKRILLLSFISPAPQLSIDQLPLNIIFVILATTYESSTLSSSSINSLYTVKWWMINVENLADCSSNTAREIEEVAAVVTSMKSPPEEKLMNIFWLRPAYQRRSLGMKWRSIKKRLTVTTTVLLFFFVICISAMVVAGWIDLAKYYGHSSENALKIVQKAPSLIEFPLDCHAWNKTNICPRNYPTTYSPNPSSNSKCPDYFRWIYEDLRHWKETGITRDMVEGSRKNAHFRLVILNGKVYIEKYRKSIQTRALFTMWGIVQLLRTYPGRLPDLELMFDCDDRPVIAATKYRGANASPPPLFRYCSDWRSLDIVFPDWSFWGW